MVVDLWKIHIPTLGIMKGIFVRLGRFEGILSMPIFAKNIIITSDFPNFYALFRELVIMQIFSADGHGYHALCLSFARHSDHHERSSLQKTNKIGNT